MSIEVNARKKNPDVKRPVSRLDVHVPEIWVFVFLSFLTFASNPYPSADLCLRFLYKEIKPLNL